MSKVTIVRWGIGLATVLASVMATVPACAAGQHSDQVAPPAPAARQKIVAFGDSITWGVGTDHPARQSWPARIHAKRVAKAGSTLIAVRAPGEVGAVKTYRDDVLTKNPDVVVVAYGMNDLKWASTHEVMAALRQIQRWNNARGIDTYFATLTPLGAKMPFGLNEPRMDLNDHIRETFGDHVLDFEQALADETTGQLPSRYDSGDGLHPNARAYMKLAAVAREALS